MSIVHEYSVGVECMSIVCEYSVQCMSIVHEYSA
jgi:hypothetical protein